MEKREVVVKRVTKKDFSRLPNKWARGVDLCDLSPLALKMFFVVLGKIQASGHVGSSAHFNWKELGAVLTPDSQRVAHYCNYTTLSAAFDELTTVKIDHSFLNPLGQREKWRSVLFQAIGVNEETGDVEVVLSTGFRKILYLLNNAQTLGWTKLMSEDVNKLHSSGQINLYLLICSYVRLTYPNARFVTIETLRRKAGLTSAYYNDWNRSRDKINSMLRRMNELLGRSMKAIPVQSKRGFQLDDVSIIGSKAKEVSDYDKKGSKEAGKRTKAYGEAGRGAKPH